MIIEPNNKNITIVIADDHPLFRSGVKAELETIAKNEIIGITGDGKEALKLILELKPDVAIIDFQMPGLTGIEILREAKKTDSITNFILLTMFRDKKIFYKAIDEGVSGYILKDEAAKDINEAVSKVSSGGMFISSDMASLLNEKSDFVDNSIKINELKEKLSAAELNIISLTIDLKSNNEISNTLFISKKTVENHKTNIAGKLGLTGSKQLLKFLLENKDYFQK